MQRFLITGAQGFVGRFVVRTVLDSDPTARVLGLGRSPRDDEHLTHDVTGAGGTLRAPIPTGCRVSADEERYRYASVDILDGAGIEGQLRAFEPDVVVHLASGLRDDPVRKLVRTNVEGTAVLLETMAAAKIGKPRFIYGSSGGVYGIPDAVPIHESAACTPIDPYSASKLAAEHCARVLATRHAIPIVMARIFNVVGPGQEERHVCGHLAQQLNAIRHGAHPAVSMGTSDTTRDFVDVRDVAQALVTLARDGEAGLAYNVGSGVETRIDELLPRMLALTGLEGRVEVKTTAGRPADIPRHVADIGRLRAKGCRPRVGLDQSLHDTLEYYRALPAGEGRP